MKKRTFIIGNILLLMLILLSSMTAKAQSYTSCVGGNPIYLPEPNVPSSYTLMWAQYSYAGSELYVVNNKVTIEKYFVGTIYVECYYKCVRQYTVAGHVYEDHQTNTTYFGIKCDPVYTTGLPNQLTMQVGDNKTIDWSYSPSYVSRPNLSWSSSDYGVVDVNSNKLTAKKSGRAVVTVKSNAGPDEYINVTVEGGSDIIYVSSISLNETSISLTEGNTKQLQATVLPSNATDKSVSWSSSNSSVAQVNSSGLVTAKSTGTATVTCKANDGSGTKATCSVAVNSSVIEPTSISLPSSKTVKVGESFTMTYTLTPSNATTTLTWTSDDTSIATVSSSGVVKGVKAGSTKIRVKTANGKTDYCNVTVENNTVEPTSISLPSSKTVKVGETFTMTYTLTPSNATTTLTWTSDDTSIATVTSSGVVKGIKAGSTKVRVKTANGKTDYCNITVNTTTVEPTSISLPSSKTVKVGETFTMTYTLTPSNATTTLTWSSDDTSIATVSSSGVVKGIKVGSTYINVKTANGKTDYCKVTVESKGNEDELNDGDTFTAISEEGVSLIYKVVSSANKTCELTRNKDYGYDNKETTTTKVTIPQSTNGYKVIAVGDDAFYYWQALKAVSLPETIVRISEGAFYGCIELTSITLPDNVEEIGEDAFANCEKLASINIPGKVKTIGGHAFWECKSLRKISLPNSLTTIGGATFRGTSLTSFTLPKSVTKIESDWLEGDNILSTCRSLKEIKVEEGNRYYDSRNSCNAIIETSTNKLISGCVNTKIPNTVSALGTYCFYYAQITSINIPNSVQTIGEHAFCGCSKLSSVVLPEKLIRIENDVFEECAKITSLDFLPPSVEYIGSWAFVSCGFSTIRIPDGIKELGRYAFGWNKGATSIIIPSSVKIMDKGVFGSSTQNVTSVISYISNPTDIDESVFEYYQSGDYFTSATLYVPKGCKSKYLQAAGWKKFSRIVEMNKIDLSVNPTSGEVKKGSVIYLKTPNVSDANIYYTLDGSTPNMRSTKYVSTGITINSSCTLKAIAYKDGLEPSEMLTETYTLSNSDFDIAFTSVGYATFYSSESDYMLPNGLSAQVITSAINNKLTYKKIADGSVSGIIPKRVPVLIESETKQKATYKLKATDTNVSYTGTNLLHGSDEATTTTGDGYHYKLSYGPSDTKWDDVFGWYWGAQNGSPFQIEGHKAWLVVPRSATTRGYTIDGDATGVIEMGAESEEDIYYDMQGRRVYSPSNSGVYIMNGKKIIIK